MKNSMGGFVNTSFFTNLVSGSPFQLMNFSHQITSSRLDFSCGLFKYDWSLCFKVGKLVSLHFIQAF